MDPVTHDEYFLFVYSADQARIILTDYVQYTLDLVSQAFFLVDNAKSSNVLTGRTFVQVIIFSSFFKYIM